MNTFQGATIHLQHVSRHHLILDLYLLPIKLFLLCRYCLFPPLQLPPLTNTKDGPVQVYKVNTDIGGYIQTRLSNSKDRIVHRLAGISQQAGLLKT